MKPNITKRVGRIIGVTDYFKTIQSIIGVVKGDINCIIYFLLKIIYLAVGISKLAVKNADQKQFFQKNYFTKYKK
jgi:hypothetical protein